jgi:hypothetical protein
MKSEAKVVAMVWGKIRLMGQVSIETTAGYMHPVVDVLEKYWVSQSSAIEPRRPPRLAKLTDPSRQPSKP